jgi:hypothetical protein
MTERSEVINWLSPVKDHVACEQSGPRGCAWRPGPFAEHREVAA